MSGTSIIFLVFGLLLICMGAFLQYRERSLLGKCTQCVKGTVKEVREDRDIETHQVSYDVLIQYTVNKTKYKLSYTAAFNSSAEIPNRGQRIAVYCDPDDPSRARTEGSSAANHIGVWIGYVMGLFFVIGSFIRR